VVAREITEELNMPSHLKQAGHIADIQDDLRKLAEILNQLQTHLNGLSNETTRLRALDSDDEGAN
jgi:hypothetical protein